MLCAKEEIPKYNKVIRNLIDIGAISQAQHTQGEFLSPYFLVQKLDKSFRFILNLKKLNEFIEAPHFKQEDYRTVLKLLQKDDYLAKIDLKDAYYSVPVRRNSRKFLRFTFNDRLFEFTCLPFGLSVSPYVFTKILKPFIHKAREQGITCVIYLDDILIIARNPEECKKNISVLVNMLQCLGFRINFKKCSLEPSQRCKFLGFIFDSKELTISLPTEKAQKIFDITSALTNKSTCKIRDFAAFVGLLVSACPAVSYGWAHTKKFEREKFLALKASRGNFDRHMYLKYELKSEFKWWLDNIKIRKMPIRHYNFAYEIYSDASLSGWGAYCQGHRVHGFWSTSEKRLHINNLELLAALNALRCFTKNTLNSEILLRVDNTTTIAYINRMGGVRHRRLGETARQIWNWCEERNLWVYASYINTCENVIADAESRNSSIETEYELSNKYFTKIVEIFGKPDIDLFAAALNAKCKMYISWKPDPSSWAVDAFTVHWNEWFFYAFPPFSMVANTLNKIIKEKSRGIVVVPKWPSQMWYPTFIKLLEKPPLVFKPNKDMLLSPFRSSHPLWNKISLEVGILSGHLFYEEVYPVKESMQ